MPVDIEIEKANRFRFLKLLHEKSGGDEHNWLSMWDLGTELGLDKPTTSRVTDYLRGENLLKFWALGGTIGITHWGIIQMEEALSHPKEPTRYFPPFVNIVQISGDVVGSQIQQATSESQQVQITEDAQLALTEFLSGLTKALSGIELKQDALRDLKADIETIKAQLSAAKPKRSILREALSSIRTILESAGAALLAAEAAKLLLNI